MDNIRRHLLQVHRKSIVQDLDVDDIIDSLFSSNALQPDDFRYILDLSKRTDKVSVLLDMLTRNGNTAFDIFVDSLKKHYDWLWEKLQIGETSSVPRDIIKESFEDGLSRGDVPRLPIHYVPRLDLEKKICDHLGELKRHSMLVLHGMAGSGKSSLAISALRKDPSLIVNSFLGNVFWINVGDCNSDEQIVMLQSRIYRKMFTSDCASTIDAISEMSSNSQSIGNDSLGWKDYKDMLKGAFEDMAFREALLIIDDLRNYNVLEAFDVGCKIAITTQDTTLVNKFHPIIVHVPDSLTEQESLQLIASCVEQEVAALPRQAVKIHNTCKGAPLLMAMLGGMLADNKERLKHDESHWNVYPRQLKNKEFFFLKYLKPTAGQSNPFLAVEMCINSLSDPKIIKTYKSLAVLRNNVKVSTKALSIIMDVPECETETLMKQFKNKSLAIEHFSVELKSYQYEIHDLIMSYLKSIHNEEEMKRLHTSLILRYKDSCLDKSLAYLPDDGYIAYYIGYHLLNSQNMDNMWDQFYSLYSDIVFIGNKIRLAGPTDVRQDLSQYSDKIIKRATDREFINELDIFISNHAHDLHRYPNTDIIQSILQHKPKDILIKKALSLATTGDGKHNLFFQFQGEQDVEDINYITLDVRDTVCVIKFFENYILVGNANGTITLWNSLENRKMKTFHGHSDAIKTIAVNYKSPFKMASTSDDGTLKIWSLDDYHYDEVDDVDSVENEDHFQTHFDTFESSMTITNPRGSLSSVCWGHDSDILLTHTNSSYIVVYNVGGAVERIEKEFKVEDKSITCSILSADDSLIICGQETEQKGKKKYWINVYSMRSSDVIMKFTESAPILMLALIPGQSKSVLALTTIHVQEHKWNHGAPRDHHQARSNVTQTKIADIEALQSEYQFQTACVSSDGLYIFVSTTDRRILIYSLRTNSLVSELNNRRGIVMSIDTRIYMDPDMGDCYHNLITKSGDDVHTVKVWFLLSSSIAPEIESSKKVKLSLKFHCVFDRLLLSSPIIPDTQQTDSAVTPLRRAETMGKSMENNSPKVNVQKSISLDRHTLRPLNLINGCNSTTNLEIPYSPLIAVIDKSNKIQILKGKKLIGETCISKVGIISVQLSPCGQYLAYGLKNGVVNLFYLKSRTRRKIMDLNDEVYYLEFLTMNILIAAGRKGGLMVYEIVNSAEGDSVAKMLILSGTELGSQELINDLNGTRKNSKLREYHNKDGDEYNKKSSPTSVSSSSTISNSFSPKNYRHAESTQLKNPPIVKCYWLDDIGLMSVAFDGTVKVWSLDPEMLAILVCRQNNNFCVSCVSLHKNSMLVLCDYNGTFQIYHLETKPDNGPPSSYLFHSDHVKHCISCCDVSLDGKILAMGLETGDIVLWHIPSKSFIYTLSLHKSKVRSLKFSPGPVIQPEPAPSSPFAKQTFNFPPIASPTAGEGRELLDKEVPMVLVSLAGQIAWWNVSYVLGNRAQHKRRSKGGSALHLLSSPRSTSMVDFTAFAESDQATSVLKSGPKQNNSTSYFEYPDLQWEGLWRGKKRKKNCTVNELLACIKLVGDEADNLMIDDNFSKFVTIDQSGTLYIMNVLDNDKSASNNNGTT